MKLTRLDIFGFKSFGSKSVLDFSADKNNSNIVAIVGPNGSGKSNVADAIRWALGEQSSSALRSKKGDDIVFVGSSTKARSSYAEVNLQLSSDQKIEVEINNKKHVFNDIDITRKLFRTGESEYLINHKRVRLFDLQQLLASCGFGQSTYTVIGQGMVDRLLFFNAAERKILFDEAAGVKQYKIKREQATKRLLGTDENLIRINDVLRELEPRVVNLRRLVKRAEGRREIEQELKEIENQYYGSVEFELTEIIKKLDRGKTSLATKASDLKSKTEVPKPSLRQEKEINNIEKSKHDLQEKIDQLLAQRDDLIRKSAFIQGQIEQFENKTFSTGTQKENFQGEKKSLAEKISFLEGKVQQNIKEADQKQAEKSRLENLEIEIKNKIEKIDFQLDKKTATQNEENNNSTNQNTALLEEKDKINRIITLFQQKADFFGSETGEIEKSIIELEKELDSLISQEINLREKTIHLEKSIREVSNRLNISKKSLTDVNPQKEKLLFDLRNELNSIGQDVLTLGKRTIIETGQQEKQKNSYLSEKNKLQKELAETLSKAYETKLGLAKITNILENQEREIKLSRHRIEEIAQSLTGFQGLNKKVDQELVDNLDHNNQKLDLVEVDLKDLKNSLGKLTNEEQTIREKSLHEEREATLIEGEISAINQEINKIDLERTRALTKLEGLEEEMKLSGVELVGIGKRNVIDQTTKDTLRIKIENLNRKKDSIGGVDPDTITEYEELDQRVSEMKQQLEDLVGAKKDLENIVKELDQKIKNNFTKTFSQIASEFDRYFNILFGGGQAELKLGEDEEGNFGVEISAHLPGKKLQSLNVLSGGERTLTSLALLFAILSVNPSPFCVLDEVDAALDEANTLQFIKILKDLAKKTQFVVISHNRETMKAANLLYGVTMDDHHISKLISIKLGEAGGLAA